MRKIAKILLVSIIISILSVSAFAYTRVDTQKPVSLSLTYEYEEKAISDMEINLYKVYNMSDSVRFKSTEEFKNAYGSETNNEFHFDLYDGYWNLKDENQNIIESQINWNLMSTTLESLLRRDIDAERQDMPKPVMTAKTDQTGTVSFGSDGNLTAGLYLVMGTPKVDGRYTYTPQTFLVSLPNLNEDDTWNYDLKAKGKMSVDYDPPSGGSTTSVTVNKVWQDEDTEGAERPDSIRVQLLRDGENYSTATLNQGNNWKYTWRSLSANYHWTVAELDIPDGYTVSVEDINGSFTITNTADTDIEDPDVPLDPGDIEDPDDPDDPGVDIDDPDVPLIDVPDIDEIPDEDVPRTDGSSTTENGEKLPQTGVLWWPVQLLTFVGIILFSIGWIDMRNGKAKR